MTRAILLALFVAGAPACATEPEPTEDLGVLGDGKSDGATSWEKTISLRSTTSTSFYFGASTAVSVSVEHESQRDADRLAMLHISIELPDGTMLTRPPHWEPSLIVPRPERPGAYRLTVTNLGPETVPVLMDIHAVTVACPDGTYNACGGCGPLQMAPGTACGCGEEVAQCVEGGVSCGRQEELLPDTDDTVDEWTEVAGELTGEGGYPQASYVVFVDDKLGGLLDPELEVEFGGGFAAEACVSIRFNNGSIGVMAECEEESGWIPHIDGGCCKSIGSTRGTTLLDVDVDSWFPSLLGQDMYWDLSVHSVDPQNAGVCSGYALRYRF